MARFVGESEILSAFQLMLRAIAGKVPIAAKNVPAYRAPGVFVAIKMTNPTMPNAKTLTFILNFSISCEKNFTDRVRLYDLKAMRSRLLQHMHKSIVELSSIAFYPSGKCF
jgi:hypothetical protein